MIGTLTAGEQGTRRDSVARGERGLLLAVNLSELSALLAGTLLSMLIRFGFGPNGVDLGFIGVGYTAFSVILSGSWFVLILLLRADRSLTRHLAEGTGYSDIVRSSVTIALAVAVYSALTQTEISRGYLVAAIPLGSALLMATRWSWRRWLRLRRRSGDRLERAVLVGPEDRVRTTAALIGNDPEAGLAVSATIATVEGSPGIRERVLCAVAASAASIVVVVGDGGHGEDMRALTWALEPLGARVLLVPQLGPIGVRRVRTVPVGRTPFIAIEPVQFRGSKYISKRLLDIVLSGIAIVMLAPLLLAIALVVRIDSPGPSLFRQQRVGRNGERFTMIKFRSMHVDAEQRRIDLAAHNDHRKGPLFKMRDDPRVTRVGRFLRKSSLDELPQLLNVFVGSMSLVGPRPPLPAEVAAYADHEQRRLLAKPGITGPWQIGGRSDLSWEDGLLLDVLYVENWSVLTDLGILFRTVRAVVEGRGAY